MPESISGCATQVANGGPFGQSCETGLPATLWQSVVSGGSCKQPGGGVPLEPLVPPLVPLVPLVPPLVDVVPSHVDLHVLPSSQFTRSETKLCPLG